MLVLLPSSVQLLFVLLPCPNALTWICSAATTNHWNRTSHTKKNHVRDGALKLASPKNDDFDFEAHSRNENAVASIPALTESSLHLSAIDLREL
jgi:hypothetical protein